MTSSAQPSQAQMGMKDVNRRDVWRIATPMILSNITVPLIGIVDTAVMGRMPDASYLAAVSAGATIYALVFFLFNFLRMSVTGFTAQAVGRADVREIYAVVVRGLVLGVSLGILIFFSQSLIASLGLSIVEASADVHDLARQYMAIRVFSAPLTLANMVIIGHLIGQKRTGLTLLHQVIINLFNVVLNITLVFGFGMDVDGVAWATVISEVCGFLFGLFLMRRVLRDRVSSDWRSVIDMTTIFERAPLVKMLSVNRDIFIRTLALQASFMTFMAVGSRFGDATFAANAVLLNFLMMAAYTSDAFAYAAETLAGEAIGQGNVSAVKRTLSFAFEPTMAFAVLTSVLYASFGGLIIDAMTTINPVREMARVYLVWVVLVPILSGPAFVLDGIFFGATRGPDIRNCMLIAFGIFAGCVLILTPLLGNHGLWLSLLVMNVMRGALLWWRFDPLLRDVGLIRDER